MLQRPNKICWLILALIISGKLAAQSGHYWSNEFLNQKIERQLLADKEIDFMSVRPYAIRDIYKAIETQTDSSLVLPSLGKGFWDIPEKGNWYFDVVPMVDFGIGYTNYANGVYTAAPGMATNTRYGKKWSLYADILVGEVRQPQYMSDFTDSTGVIASRGKNRATEGNPSFVKPNVRLSFAPSEYFEFELGYGTNFIGQGYRSLFLSDVAFNYPYFKMTTDVWRFKYVNIFSALQGSEGLGVNRGGFEPKYTTSHYLNWAISPRFNIGLFETMVWQGRDTLSNRGFDPNYLNPVIFYRPVEYSVGSPDNALIGVDLSFKVTTRFILYGQFVIDEFLLSEFRDRTGWWANKWAVQLGFKTFDPFGLEGLHVQGEFNAARPFIYTHGSVLQNFGHYNQPLAHQLGANFYEGIFKGYYEKENWYGEALFMYSEYGRDPDDLNMGSDIFNSYKNPAMQYGNKIGQGIKCNLYFQKLTAGYILNRNINLRAAVSYIYRRNAVDNQRINREHIFGIELSTSFYNMSTVF